MNISVRVRLFASLRKDNTPSVVELSLTHPCTARSILKELELSEEAIMVVMINGRRGKLDDPLSDGAEVQLFPLIGGG